MIEALPEVSSCADRGGSWLTPLNRAYIVRYGRTARYRRGGGLSFRLFRRCS